LPLCGESSAGKFARADTFVTDEALHSAEVVMHAFVRSRVPQSRLVARSVRCADRSEAYLGDARTPSIWVSGNGGRLPSHAVHHIAGGEVAGVGPGAIMPNADVVGQFDTQLSADEPVLN
jgi:hypothetical protein